MAPTNSVLFEDQVQLLQERQADWICLGYFLPLSASVEESGNVVIRMADDAARNAKEEIVLKPCSTVNDSK